MRSAAANSARPAAGSITGGTPLAASASASRRRVPGSNRKILVRPSAEEYAAM
jgi:hypothetical protein